MNNELIWKQRREARLRDRLVKEVKVNGLEETLEMVVRNGWEDRVDIMELEQVDDEMAYLRGE